MQSALSSLKDGIKLEKGKNNQDFSHENGYYLSDNITLAAEWGDKKAVKQKGSRALFVYNVSASKLSEFEYEIFTKENMEKWTALVCLCRRGKESPAKLYEGPMCENGCKCRLPKF